jgi:glucokinase
VPNEARVIALDLSATFGEGIRGALVGADATVLASRQSMVPTAENDLVNVIVTMAGRLADQAAREGPAAAAIALAVPGTVDEVVGAVRRSPNLALRRARVRELLEERLRRPIFLVQSGRAGLTGESLLGAGRGATEVLFVTIGTGVGSAIMSHGRVLTGAHGVAGEIGHISVDPAGSQRSCGGRGCLETFVAEPWLARRYTLLSGKPISGREVIQRFAAGDPAAVSTWTAAIDALTSSISTAVVLLDCELVILAGKLVAGSDMVAGLRNRLEQKINLVAPPQVRAVSLDDAAEVMGAAAVAFERAGHGRRDRGLEGSEYRAVPPPRIGGSALRQALSVHTSKCRRGGPGRSPWRRTVLAWIGDDTRAAAARNDPGLPRIP